MGLWSSEKVFAFALRFLPFFISCRYSFLLFISLAADDALRPRYPGHAVTSIMIEGPLLCSNGKRADYSFFSSSGVSVSRSNSGVLSSLSILNGPTYSFIT